MKVVPVKFFQECLAKGYTIVRGDAMPECKGGVKYIIYRNNILIGCAKTTTAVRDIIANDLPNTFAFSN